MTRPEHDGSATVLATSYNGHRLNSPNDVVEHSDGSIWFTDPSYGIHTDYEGHEASPEIGSRNVYRLDLATGELTSVVEDFAQPNGLAFSPDERRLFIVDSELHHIRVFNVDHGTLTGGELFCADDQGYDGIRFDHLGRLWGAAHDGLHCYHPDGSLIGKLRLPEITANLSFGVASEIISTSPRPARSTGSESISEPPPTQRDRRYLLPAAVNLMRVVAAIDKAASSRVNTRHRAESFRGKLLVQQMFARTVRLDGLVSPSEARLLGVVALTIVSLIFISTLINPPQWLQLSLSLFI